VLDDAKKWTDDGVQKVSASSKVLTQNAGQVTDIETQISDIAARISAQSSAITTINGRISELDQATRSNSKLSSDSLAATEALNKRAQDLREKVALFHIQPDNAGYGFGTHQQFGARYLS
jgi:methyl-accepting chemotaxis protein